MATPVFRYLLTLRLVALLLSATAASAAPIEVPPPSNDPAARFTLAVDTGTRDSRFVGNYGETLVVPGGWTVEARMRGVMEIVDFHRLDYGDPVKWPAEVKEDATGTRVTFRAPPFVIDHAEYKPENFTRLELMQLLVIPKDAPGGYSTLQGLRKAKETALRDAGFAFTVQGSTWFNGIRDSFSVTVSSPFSLWQAYTQSDRHIFILTAGLYPDRPYPLAVADPIASSLADHLNGFSKKVEGQNLLHDAAAVIYPLAAALLFAGLAAAVPRRGRWTSGIHRAGLAMLIGTALWPLYGLPLIYAGFRSGHELWLNSGSVLLLTAVLMPWVFQAYSRHREGLSPRRVFIGTALLSLFVGCVGCGIVSLIQNEREVAFARGEFWSAGALHALFILAYGIVFALTHKEPAEGP